MITEINNNMKIYCQNCGNEAHEGPLFRNEIDYDGRKYKIEICRHFRQEEIKQKVTIPEDLFNGA